MLDYLIEAFSGPGSAFMYAITALMAFALAVGLERAFLLLLRWRVDTKAVASKLQDPKAAAEVAGGTPLGNVLRAGAGESDAEAAWDAMGAATAAAEARLSNRVDYVGTIANMATMKPRPRLRKESARSFSWPS